MKQPINGSQIFYFEYAKVYHIELNVSVLAFKTAGIANHHANSDVV